MITNKSIFLALLVSLLTIGCSKSDQAQASIKIDYPDSVEGLTALANDLLKSNQANLKAIAATLNHKQADQWFRSTFGDEKGAQLTAEYKAMNIDAMMPSVIADIKAKGRTEVLVEKFSDGKNPGANTLQMVPLQDAKDATLALYSVRFHEPGKSSGYHMYSFVYIDGKFRLMGKMAALHGPENFKDPTMAAVMELRHRDREEFFKSGKLPD